MKEPKVKSLIEAMIILEEDVAEYLTSENLTETANGLSKVLSNIQSTRMSHKLKASAQSRGLFQMILLSCFKNSTFKK